MTAIYQLKIEISGSQPPIWREIRVGGDTTFSELHDIIRIAFGADADQEYEFVVNKMRIYDFGAVFDMGDNPEERDSVDTELEEYINITKTQFTYTSMDDKWEHHITLEDIYSDDKNLEHPVCIAGERACPPAGFGIEAYQSMLHVLSDANHPEYNATKQKLGKKWDAEHFDISQVNKRLKQYAQEWDDIYDETEEIIERLENSDLEDDALDGESLYDFDEYESVEHLNHPGDLLNDELETSKMVNWISKALKDEDSLEYRAFKRLLDLGHDESKATSLIMECLAIEWFYELKYGTNPFDERFAHNLDRLPEKPLEIANIEHAIWVLGNVEKGIPFQAIQYLYDNKSPAATSAIIKALKNFSDHQYCWRNCTTAPLWYALAAEGHLCQELIDPVIGLCKEDFNGTDWLHEQAEFLIGKLAQKYPDVTASKVLEVMEKDATEGTDGYVYYLFDVFYFCDIGKYKPRLLALLERAEISWHDALASTLSFLQVKEALPILQRQLAEIEEDPKARIADLKEAIEELEAGESLYPDVDTPLCLRRTTTWKEEFEDLEDAFYEEPDDLYGDFDLYSEPPSYKFDDFWSPQQPIVKEKKPGRNDPCPCGSGKKYKKCCMDGA